MKPVTRKMLYTLLAVLLLFDFYAIFNAGNPNSIFRAFIRDPAYDVSFTVFLSILIAVISLAMASDGNENSLRALLQKNHAHIQELRKKGVDEESIAASFVQELGAKNRTVRRLLQRRVCRLLRRIR